MKTTGLWTILLLAPGAWGTPASDAADRYYRAIRNHDVTALRSLIKSGDVNTRDKRDATPLMFASASRRLGSPAALDRGRCGRQCKKRLRRDGADVVRRRHLQS